MSDQFLGEIRVFPYNFAPYGWAYCHGQIVSISQYSALFALVGTYYGGNGTSTFALPNLQDNLAIDQGTGTGLSPRVIGETFGESAHTLLNSEMPLHNHSLTAGDGVAYASQQRAPSATAYWGRERGGAYSTIANTTLSPQTIGPTGGGQPHSNLMPTLSLNPCIALTGVFPSRN